MEYCDDSTLAYVEYKTNFQTEKHLQFDKAYRLAHLPLVAPNHPRVIKSQTGFSYNMGRREAVFSIALPLPEDKLFSSAKFQELLHEVKSSSFNHKISWDTFELRKDRLHATVCGSVPLDHPLQINPNIVAKLKSLGPIGIRYQGLFSGNRNVGRLYLRAYPELRNSLNMCHEIQQVFGLSRTNFYAAGIFNLTEELTLEETRDFKALVDRWWDQSFFEWECSELWLIESTDDLVLNGSIAKILSLVE